MWKLGVFCVVLVATTSAAPVNAKRDVSIPELQAPEHLYINALYDNEGSFEEDQENPDNEDNIPEIEDIEEGPRESAEDEQEQQPEEEEKEEQPEEEEKEEQPEEEEKEEQPEQPIEVILEIANPPSFVQSIFSWPPSFSWPSSFSFPSFQLPTFSWPSFLGGRAVVYPNYYQHYLNYPKYANYYRYVYVE